jgi:hypothetical protein
MWEISKELTDPFLHACKEASEDIELLNNFRRDERIHPILEHVSYEEGLLYLKERKVIFPKIEDIICKIKENDLLGNPILYDYPRVGFISPTTLRYAKNVYDIASMVVPIEERVDNVVEIGGGYGGLCRMVSGFFPVQSYLLVDFPEVNQLSNRYLSYYFGECKGIGWITPENVDKIKNIHMCISNYAFSECNTETQKKYYDSIIKNSNMFYITYNHISDNNMSFEEFKEFASKDFDIRVEEEIRDSHKNYVMFGYNRDYFSSKSRK